MCTPTARDSYERLSLAGQALPPGFPSPFLFPDGLSSIETLLTNIQVSSADRAVSSQRRHHLCENTLSGAVRSRSGSDDPLDGCSNS